MYHHRKSGELFANASDKPTCQAITDRGIAMIPLPSWGRILDWRTNKKEGFGTYTSDVCTLCEPHF